MALPIVVKISALIKQKKSLEFSKDFDYLLVPKKRLELLLPYGN